MSHITKQVRELKEKQRKAPPPAHGVAVVMCNRLDLRMEDGRWVIAFGHDAGNTGVTAWHGAISVTMDMAIKAGGMFLRTAQEIQKARLEAATKKAEGGSPAVPASG